MSNSNHSVAHTYTHTHTQNCLIAILGLPGLGSCPLNGLKQIFMCWMSCSDAVNDDDETSVQWPLTWLTSVMKLMQSCSAGSCCWVEIQGQRSMVKVTSPTNAHTVNVQYLPNGKAYKLRQAQWPPRSKVKVARSRDASDNCWLISRGRPKLVGRLSWPGRKIVHSTSNNEPQIQG